MPAVVCPYCGTESVAEVADGGQGVICPNCRLPPGSRDACADNSDQNLIDHARSECRGPASMLSFLGVLTAMLGFLTMFIAVMRVFRWLNAPTALGLSTEAGTTVYIAVGLANMFTGGFMTYAARLMHRAEHYPICVIACIMAFVNPCCVGILVGVNGLNRLRDPGVRKGFAANRPDFDPDSV